ncbi:MAG: YkgJ family cysteine cluster protein [Candidatus Omnitrophica bacterium]|nr:YkgJ family cysteine cluster protein [Candidatus Omnitrophota bacterium]
MLEGLPSFAISEVCLKCDGCCRFYEPESSWRPRCGKEEIKAIGRPDIIDERSYIRAPQSGDKFLCVCLAKDEHCCDIYTKRPFECKVYPFVLMKRGNKIVLSAHTSCPMVGQHRNTQKFFDYEKQLKEFFARPEVLDFLRNNKHLAGDYPGYQEEFEDLFEVKI